MKSYHRHILIHSQSNVWGRNAHGRRNSRLSLHWGHALHRLPRKTPHVHSHAHRHHHTPGRNAARQALGCPGHRHGNQSVTHWLKTWDHSTHRLHWGYTRGQAFQKVHVAYALPSWTATRRFKVTKLPTQPVRKNLFSSATQLTTFCCPSPPHPLTRDHASDLTFVM